MSEFDLTEDVQPEETPDEVKAEEYEPDEADRVSPDTGTHYGGEGEAETTPQDEELVEDGE